MNRPTFFLSSTIYDFRDLRSAIKFTLEGRGCRVLASEFNDFGGNLDTHSYESCLKNIEQADYFVLLIGGRVGGWYDETGRISITQQEYRTAYDLHKVGKLKIVTFVRSEVWQLREDRKALAKYLLDIDILEKEKESIRKFPSKFVTDADFIGEFITEVGRNSETTEAVKNGTPKPTGNWIHAFHDFRDIHDALDPLAFSGRTADEAAFAKSLQHELLEILSKLLWKHEKKPIDPRPPLQKHLEKWPIEREVKNDENYRIENSEWQKFSTLFISILGVHFDLIVVSDALTSSLFLHYEPSNGSYTQSPAYGALFTLIREIRRFNSINTSETLAVVYKYSPIHVGKSGTLDIPTMSLAMLYGLAQRWINIVSLSLALAHHLGGSPFVAPELMPFSPIKGMDDAIEKERVSIADLRAALGL